MMSSTTFGRAMRIESSGTSVCPPAITAGVAAFGGEHVVRLGERLGAHIVERRGLHAASHVSAASFAGRERQVDLGDAERVRDRIGDAHRRAHAIALADALGAERRERRRRFEMQDQRRRHFGRGRHQIVGERAGDEAAVVGVDVFLVERRAERVREAAGHLARHHAGMQHAAAVVHGDVFVDAHRAGDAVDLDAAEIENEAVAERRVDAVVLGRRGQLRRRPEHGLAQRLIVLRRACRAPSAPRRRGARTAARCRDCPSRARGLAANSISSAGTLSCAAAARASFSLMPLAASCTAPHTAGAKRLA